MFQFHEEEFRESNRKNGKGPKSSNKILTQQLWNNYNYLHLRLAENHTDPTK
jgi:hypothetical protein